VILVWAVANVAAAQDDNGTLRGRVLDDHGVGVASAPVQARHAESHTDYRETSGSDGVYSIHLPRGTYDVSAAVSGFDQKRVNIDSGKTANADLHLVDLGITLETIGEDLTSRIAAANRPPPPNGPPLRSLDGRPDLAGVWWSPTTIDPGKPELLPAADALFKERTVNNIKDSPSARCLPDAVLRLAPFFKLVQTPALMILILEEESPGYRQIFIDGRTHPADPDPTWYGHAVGRWEGDTLVVDTVGFNPDRWLTTRGQPISAQLHVIERFRRRDLGHLEIETTIDDPGTFARPWTMKRVADLAPGIEIQEYVCENNRDPAHLIGK
jgi:hypothetical protein